MSHFYCITTYNRPDQLPRAVEAALGSSAPPHTLVVVDNSDRRYASEVLSSWADDPRLVVITKGWNAGLPRSINLCCRLFSGPLVFANDDVAVHHYSLDYLLSRMRAQPRAGVYFGARDGYSFFGLERDAWAEVGGFDEAFYPVWFDDLDFDRRLRLAGYQPVVVEEATFEHVGSGSMHQLIAEQGQAAHNARFERNRDLYVSKWGGQPGEERYSTPYNGA